MHKLWSYNYGHKIVFYNPFNKHDHFIGSGSIDAVASRLSILKNSTNVEQDLKAYLILSHYGDVGLSMYEQLTPCFKDNDSMVMITRHEVKGTFYDYLVEQFKQLMLLIGLALP